MKLSYLINDKTYKFLFIISIVFYIIINLLDLNYILIFFDYNLYNNFMNNIIKIPSLELGLIFQFLFYIQFTLKSIELEIKLLTLSSLQLIVSLTIIDLIFKKFLIDYYYLSLIITGISLIVFAISLIIYFKKMKIYAILLIFTSILFFVWFIDPSGKVFLHILYIFGFIKLSNKNNFLNNT